MKHTREEHERWGELLKQHFPEDITAAEMQHWEGNAIALKRALRKALRTDTELFTLVTTTNVGATEARPTSQCFSSKWWVKTLHEFGERWLLKEQPATEACSLTILSSEREATFQEWAADLLEVPDYTSEAELEQLLISRGHTLTLPQIEMLVKRPDSWDIKTLYDKKPGNFFFTRNNVGGISVVNIQKKHEWTPYLKGFTSEHRRRPRCRVVVANLDATRFRLAQPV